MGIVGRRQGVEYDKEKVEEAVLALLHLTTFDSGSGRRAWKGQDWDALDRLYHKEYIGNPRSKAKSVPMTENGLKRSAELFQKFFVTTE